MDSMRREDEAYLRHRDIGSFFYEKRSRDATD